MLGAAEAEISSISSNRDMMVPLWLRPWAAQPMAAISSSNIAPLEARIGDQAA